MTESQDTANSDAAPLAQPEPKVNVSDDGGTTTTAFPNGIVRTDVIAKQVITYPTVVIQIKTTTFQELCDELDIAVSKIKKLDGTVPANFQVIIPAANCMSSTDYTLPNT